MILISLLFVLVAQTQDKARPANAAQTTAADTNPFRPSEAMLRALGGVESTTASGSADGFRHLENVPQLPRMHLRGVLKMKQHDKPAALIEVDDLGHYSVREGESFSFTLAWHQVVPNVPARSTSDDAPARQSPLPAVLSSQIPVVLRVERIERDGVIVEVGTLGERLVIR
jgi:hypothetical protein